MSNAFWGLFISENVFYFLLKICIYFFLIANKKKYRSLKWITMTTMIEGKSNVN